MTKSKRFIENRMESYRIRRHRGFQNETKHSKQKRFKFLSKERLCNGLALRGSKLSTSQHFRSQNKLLCSCLKCLFLEKMRQIAKVNSLNWLLCIQSSYRYICITLAVGSCFMVSFIQLKIFQSKQFWVSLAAGMISKLFLTVRTVDL